jgi:glycosyltransferase involved in cell wall biosynthesis
MPVRNPHPEYFPAAVASIQAQTFTDWELVIVEDPSPASAATLLQPFVDRRIRHIRNDERTGLIAQRNRTLAEARAELVAFLDADDVAEPERLARQVSFLQAHVKIALVGGQLRIIDRSGRLVGSRAYPTQHEAILRAMPYYNAIAQPAVMARKKVLLQAGGYTFPWPAEDYDLWSRLLLAGHRFENLAEPLTRYRVHPLSGSKGTHLRSLLKLTAEIKRHYWWNRMTWQARCRYWGECGLRLVPPTLVACLFAAITYRSSDTLADAHSISSQRLV